MHLIFLHGLLGSQADWAPLFQHIQQQRPHWQLHALDLPYHGRNRAQCLNFHQADQWLAETIQAHVAQEPYFLIGYSLGGRLALHFASQPSFQRPRNLKGVLLEGANIGLAEQDHAGRAARWENDIYWAQQFEQIPIEAVLEKWYQQAVFSDLTASQRAELIEKRRQNDGKAIAAMLRATSLAKQPFIDCTKLPYPHHFIIGKRDQKFLTMAQEHALPFTSLNGGHNCHWESPEEFTNVCIQFCESHF